jgi:hypothetical protein
MNHDPHLLIHLEIFCECFPSFICPVPPCIVVHKQVNPFIKFHSFICQQRLTYSVHDTHHEIRITWDIFLNDITGPIESLENNIFHCHGDLVVPIWLVAEGTKSESSVYLIFSFPFCPSYDLREPKSNCSIILKIITRSSLWP